MSFKRFDTEDIVLSSEIITFPTWYSQEKGDTSELNLSTVVTSPEQGASQQLYLDYYSGYSSTGSVVFDAEHSKALFSLAYAKRYDESGSVSSSVASNSGSIADKFESANLIFGQYRTLVLGDEDSEFRFGSSVKGANGGIAAKSFIALSVDRLRFREKLDPDTCRFIFKASASQESTSSFVVAPDINASERYIDAGRVYDLAKLDETGSYVYPTSGSGITSQGSYGYFLPDIGVVLFNTDNYVLGDYGISSSEWTDDRSSQQKIETFESALKTIELRSQETVTSNYVFVRARNGEFNYSTNPSNITGSAGNIRWDVMVNQPQSFITTVGLYNDSNDLLAVAKLSRPLVKDFTKEALIRIKLDY